MQGVPSIPEHVERLAIPLERWLLDATTEPWPQERLDAEPITEFHAIPPFPAGETREWRCKTTLFLPGDDGDGHDCERDELTSRLRTRIAEAITDDPALGGLVRCARLVQVEEPRVLRGGPDGRLLGLVVSIRVQPLERS